MDRELTITPILLNHQAHPSSNAWVKLLDYEPTQTDVLATRGKMYAVISLSSMAEIDFTPIMELINETLHQRYFGITEGGILQTLESALDAIHKQLLLAGQQDKRLSAGFSFDVLVAVSWGTVLYLGQLGSSRACLLRQEKLHDIDEGDQKSTNLYLSSGVVQAGDRFLLATSHLLTKFNRKQILHYLSLPPDTITQSLEQQLDHNPNSLESGIMLLVDIKQVPSIQDESLQIFDADTLQPTAKIASALQTINQTAGATLSRTKKWSQSLWHWRLFGRLPGLPLVIILICALLLLSSVAFKYLNHSTTSTADITPTVTQLQTILSQAQQVADINPDRSQDLLNQMQPTLSQALKGSSDKRLSTISNQRQQLQDKLLQVQVLSAHPLVSTSVLPSQPKLTIQDGNLYFIDPKARQLLRLKQQSLQTLSTNQQLFTQDSHLAATSQGLVDIQTGLATPINSSGKSGQSVTLSNDQVISAASYQQNAYALTSVGQLVKLVNSDGKLSSPSNYFNSSIDSKKLLDVAIDGAVYILRTSGTIEKYLGGQPKALSLDRSGLATGARALFTDESTDNLYVLTDHAVVVWSKEGQYLGQYRLTSTAKWQAAAVDGSTKTLYILSEGKLVSAELPK